jgi:hypothetical protein
MTREQCGLFAIPRTVAYLFNYPYTAQVRPSAENQAKPYGEECALWSIWKPKDDFYRSSVSFPCLINVVTSLRC